eukprot:7706662-Pyramimonas_sp.AAC.1
MVVNPIPTGHESAPLYAEIRPPLCGNPPPATPPSITRTVCSSAPNKPPWAALQGHCEVMGLLERRVRSAGALMEFFDGCAVGRTTCATKLNATSSRSHAIYMVRITRTTAPARGGEQGGAGGGQTTIVGKLNLVGEY